MLQLVPKTTPIDTSRTFSNSTPFGSPSSMGSPTSTLGSFPSSPDSESADMMSMTTISPSSSNSSESKPLYNYERPRTAMQSSTGALDTPDEPRRSYDSARFHSYGRHSNTWLFGDFSFRRTARHAVERLRGGHQSPKLQ